MFYTHIANGFFTAQELAITNQNDPNYIPRFAGQVTPGSIKVLNLGTSSDVPGIHNSVDKVLDAGDRVVTGSPYPKFTFGMTNRFNYKNVDMSVLVQGSQGNHVYTQYKYWTNNLDGSFNVEKEVANRWRSESNPGAGILPTTNGNTNTIRDAGANAALLNSYVKDASFIAIRNITLGYNFKLKTSFSNSFRAYFSTQNPFIFTKYKGSNPEVNTSGNTPLNPGIDTQGYPIGITYSAGLNMRF